jgi:CBS domain-containing protein
MLVKQIMTKDPIFRETTDTVKQIINTMIENDISAVLIMGNNRPRGIITERDIVRNLGSMSLEDEASEIMSCPLKTIREDNTIVDAVEVMVKNNIKKLVVVNDVEAVGIITQTDIIRNLGSLM